MTRAAQGTIDTPDAFLGAVGGCRICMYGIPLPCAFQLLKMLFAALEIFRLETESMVNAQLKVWSLLCKGQLLECLTAIGKLVEIVRVSVRQW